MLCSTNMLDFKTIFISTSFFINVNFLIVCSLSMNVIRHMAASLSCALLTKADQGAMAQLMCHSKDTQERVYDQSVKTNRSVRISSILAKMLSGDMLTSKDLEEAKCGKFTKSS